MGARRPSHRLVRFQQICFFDLDLRRSRSREKGEEPGAEPGEGRVREKGGEGGEGGEGEVGAH